jgi:hypothetical protein
MKDSLGGTAKTLMFVNVSPSVYNESESRNSMDYAIRAKGIKNKVIKNVDTRETAHLKQAVRSYEQIIERYKDILSKSNMSDELAALENLTMGVVASN